MKPLRHLSDAFGPGDRVFVPALSAQGLCTLPRHFADAVIAKHGIAELPDRSVEQRAQALIGIAAPEHRTGLAAAWDALRAGL